MHARVGSPRRFVEVRIVVRMRGSVVGEDDLSAFDGGAGQPAPGPDGVGMKQVAPLEHQVELAVHAAEALQREGAGVGLARPERLAEDAGEELVERRRPAHRALEVEQELEIADAMLELLLDLEQLGVLLRDGEEEARVVDRDRRLGGERGEDDRVVIAEGPGLLVEDLDDADRPPEVVLHRDGEDRSRPVARREVQLGVEARVAVRIVDEERLARPRDMTGDALPHLEADSDGPRRPARSATRARSSGRRGGRGWRGPPPRRR